ncbi:response regulator transcription factor [Paenibacillus thermotolerans]|uniref:response regulator transcription factor n=1 Tax=Paenibacillus thermotolerans TaxID=3027807 RepID=UPI002367C4BD|nr:MULTISPECIES: response regulator transcription factor [unclassified Paenibacillus]
MISLLIVDDDMLIRESLKMILDLQPDITVAGVCGNGREAADFVRAGNPRPDVVLMDIRMPECDGVEGTRLIKEIDPNVKVLILTTFDDDDILVRALRFGANGYLVKNVSPERIAEGIRTVHNGNMVLHSDIAKKLSDMLQPAPKTTAPDSVESAFAGAGLTPAEMKIVAKIADGLTNKEIAGELFLSEGTVKNYITVILEKLALRDRTQIAIQYWKHRT